VTYTVTPFRSSGLFVTGQQLQEMAYFLKKRAIYILDFTATRPISALQSRFERIAKLQIRRWQTTPMDVFAGF
jgi:hypothetical protein